MKRTRVIGLDVYGTILPSRGNQVKRRGLDAFLERCRNLGVRLCTCSDAQITSLLGDFKEAGLDKEYFDSFFKMQREGKEFYNHPKNFDQLLEYYNLHPEELLIIGDREKRDIKPARDLGCKTILVPEYEEAKDNNFDLSKLELP